MTEIIKTEHYVKRDHYYAAAQEDRCAPRVRLSIPVTLRPSGGRGFSSHVQDLSLGGFSAICVNRLPVGSLAWLKLPGLEAQQCEVIWWQDHLVGCAFQNLLSPIVYDDIVTRYRDTPRRAV